MNHNKLIQCLINLCDDEVKNGVLWKEFEFKEIRKKGSVPFNAAYFSVLENSRTNVDMHREREIWIVIGGAGELEYDNKKRYIKSGDIIFFESEYQHAVRNIGGESLEIYSIYWKP